MRGACLLSCILIAGCGGVSAPDSEEEEQPLTDRDETSPMAPMPTDKVSAGHRQTAPDPLAEAAPQPPELVNRFCPRPEGHFLERRVGRQCLVAGSQQ